jgi:hypothetical protein
MTNPIMTPALITPAQLQRQTFSLRNQGYWMRLGADALATCATYSTKLPEAKRAKYAREARKEYKQAAAFYAQAAASCEAWLEADSGKGVRWFYHAFPAILKRCADRCAAAAKLIK